MTSEALLVELFKEAFKQGAGFVLSLVLLLLWRRDSRAREGSSDRREAKLIDVAERLAVASERQSVICQETSERITENQRENARQFATLLLAIKDASPRRMKGGA
jgi:hypothetical protein